MYKCHLWDVGMSGDDVVKDLWSPQRIFFVSLSGWFPVLCRCCLDNLFRMQPLGNFQTLKFTILA